MRSVKIFFLVFSLFLVIDLIWLGVVMKDFYKNELGSLARRNGDSLAPNIPAALLVYFLIVVGLVLFVLPKFGPQTSLFQACAWGAGFGVVLYGVYDLTNYALVANWSPRMALADIVWGGVICGVTSLAMFLASNWIAY